MKLLVGGKEYDHVAALSDGSLGLWVDVKRATGYGRRSLQEALIQMQDLRDALDIYENVTVMEGLLALVYLVRRHGGEQVDWDEVRGTSFDDIAWRVEEGELPEPDPTQPVALKGSGDGTSSAGQSSGGRSSTRSSKTSKAQLNATA